LKPTSSGENLIDSIIKPYELIYSYNDQKLYIGHVKKPDEVSEDFYMTYISNFYRDGAFALQLNHHFSVKKDANDGKNYLVID
jgi:hypothetical protein